MPSPASSRSLLLAALKQAGVRTPRGRSCVPLAADWQALRALLPDANARCDAVIQSLRKQAVQPQPRSSKRAGGRS